MINDEKKEENEVSASDEIVSEEKDSNDSPDVTELDVEKTENKDSGEKDDDSKSSPKEEKILKPGAQLAAYREAAGITLEQVAASLKMTVQQVRELEADNYERLHGVAISRGFVRAYAKMLQVDPTPLVAMFSNESTTKQLDPIRKARPSQEFIQNRQPFGKKTKGKTIWIILIIVLLGLIYAAYSMKWFSSSSKTEEKKKEIAAEVKKVESKTELVKKKEEKPVEVVAEKKEIAEPVKPEPVKVEEIVPEKTVDAKPEEKEEKTEKVDLSQSSPEKTQEMPPAKPNYLVLYFNGPSEIQLLKADGTLLREFEGQAGSVEKIEIKEPVTVVVEKALHVQAEFREQPLVLRTARMSPEARISLK